MLRTEQGPDLGWFLLPYPPLDWSDYSILSGNPGFEKSGGGGRGGPASKIGAGLAMLGAAAFGGSIHHRPGDWLRILDPDRNVCVIESDFFDAGSGAGLLSGWTHRLLRRIDLSCHHFVPAQANTVLGRRAPCGWDGMRRNRSGAHWERSGDTGRICHNDYRLRARRAQRF